jgi:hypothetical protein
MRTRSIDRFFVVFCLTLLGLQAQQVPDRSFRPPPFTPKFASGDGPSILIDAGHGNFHTADGGYLPFATVLRKDGFRVRSVAGEFSRSTLGDAALLVVVNALHERNIRRWRPPIHQAIAQREVEALVSWAKQGGSLFLVADHQPFPAAVSALASAFGFEFHNGWAVQAPHWSTDFGFRRTDGSLADHVAVSGSRRGESAEKVITFGGSAFRGPPEAISLMTFGEGFYSFQPKDRRAFDEESDPHIAIDGWSQGAVRRFGKGRVAVFGEAAMFTAQLAGKGRQPFGFNLPEAEDNVKLLLNTVRWLTDGRE